MAKFKDISIAEWKKLSEEEQKNFKEVIKKTFLGMNKVSMENQTEAARSEKKKIESRKKNLDVMSGIWKQSKITSTAVKVMQNNWGKILGLAIFLLPKKFWVGLKDSLFRLYDFFKSGKWKDWTQHIGKIGIGLGVLAGYFALKSPFMVGMAAFNALVIGFKGLKWAGGKIVGAGKTIHMNKVHGDALTENKEFNAKKNATKKVSAIPENDMTVTKKGKVSWWKKLVKEIDGKVIKAAKFSVRGLKMVPVVGAILGTIVESVIAIITGDKMAEEWGVGKDSAIAGALLGGAGEPGGWNIVGQMLTYGTLGFAAGGPVGLAAGIIMGAVMGIIGGKKMAQAFENLKLKFETLWIEWVETPFELFMMDIDNHFIKPMNEFFEPIGKWIDEKMSPIIKGFKNWYTGIQKWIEGLSFIKTISDFIGGSAEENERKLEIARKRKEDAEKEKERRLQAERDRIKQEEIAEKEKEIAKLKKEVAEDEKNIAKGKDSYGFWGRSRESRLDDNLARLTELTGETHRRRQSQGAPQGAQRTTAPAKPTGSKATPASPVSSGHELITTPSPISASNTSYPRIPDDGGTTNMDGVRWNKMHTSGRSGVEAAIWEIYNNHGKKPVFVSGLRDKNHALYNPKSQHAYGLGFDLRSRSLGSSKDAISNDLHRVFNQKGWFMQEEIAGQANTTGTKATGDHFHIHKAAKGFHGVVESATGFIAGEAGSERVDITPLNGPNAKLATFNNLQNQNLDAQRMGGSGGGTTIVAPQTTKVSQSSTTAVMSNPTAKDTFWLDA